MALGVRGAVGIGVGPGLGSAGSRLVGVRPPEADGRICALVERPEIVRDLEAPVTSRGVERKVVRSRLASRVGTGLGRPA